MKNKAFIGAQNFSGGHFLGENLEISRKLREWVEFVRCGDDKQKIVFGGTLRVPVRKFG